MQNTNSELVKRTSPSEHQSFVCGCRIERSHDGNRLHVAIAHRIKWNLTRLVPDAYAKQVLLPSSSVRRRNWSTGRKAAYYI